MSDDMYEVAFMGQIREGADIAQVKQAVAKLFKADEVKIQQLFSGRRILIKKNIDRSGAEKYQQALANIGAICELKNLSESMATEVEAPRASHPVPAAPDTTPLHINAAEIDDLSASLAPVGSDMQDAKDEVDEFQMTLDDLTVAPVGSDMSENKKNIPPLKVDTSGLSLEE